MHVSGRPKHYTYLGRELVNSVSLNGVNSEAVVGVDGGEAARHWDERTWYVPKNFLLAPLDSITSSRPGRICSTVGTWAERIPRSPVTAGTFT